MCMLQRISKHQIVHNSRILFMALAVLFSISACSIGTWLPKAPAGNQEPVITIGPGDEIQIKFAYAEQFNDEPQRVRQDGMIQLLLIGDVMAQGKTPAELKEELEKLYAAQLKHPELAVVVRYSPVYVTGEVEAPGQMIEYYSRLTALEAIMHAGGFNIELAKPENVVVIRHTQGKRYSYKLDLEKSLKKKSSTPFYLQPRDIVFVPRTTIVNVDVWVDQHIRRLIPIGVGGGFSFGS